MTTDRILYFFPKNDVIAVLNENPEFSKYTHAIMVKNKSKDSDEFKIIDKSSVKSALKKLGIESVEHRMGYSRRKGILPNDDETEQYLLISEEDINFIKLTIKEVFAGYWPNSLCDVYFMMRPIHHRIAD